MNVSATNLLSSETPTFSLLSSLQSSTGGPSSGVSSALLTGPQPSSHTSELSNTANSDLCRDSAQVLLNSAVNNTATTAPLLSPPASSMQRNGNLGLLTTKNAANTSSNFSTSSAPTSFNASNSIHINNLNTTQCPSPSQHEHLPSSPCHSMAAAASYTTTDERHLCHGGEHNDNNYLIKNEILNEQQQQQHHENVLASNTTNNNNRTALAQLSNSLLQASSSTGLHSGSCDAILQLNNTGTSHQSVNMSASSLHSVLPLHHHSSHHLMRHLQLQQQQTSHHLFTSVELAAAAAAAAAANSTDPRQHLHYAGNNITHSVVGADCISTQKAVAFLAGPRERIHVLGTPVEHCPRCQQEGLGTTGWRPHRHIGELKIRYICERHFDDLESNHHFDIPLCPICNQVLYLYDFNNMLGVSNARRLHKYVLKCANRHVLPLLDLFCQTKKGGERCNANFKLQWCYGTMVKRCEAQKNRDHDLWWVRYKNEWKQRRTIIRYKKDFLSHLSDVQRSLLLGLGLEGEPPPDPKSVLGPTFDALLSTVGGNPNGPKIKKRTLERSTTLNHQDRLSSALDNYDLIPAKQQRYHHRSRLVEFNPNVSIAEYSAAVAAANRNAHSTHQGTNNTSIQQRNPDSTTTADTTNTRGSTASLLDDPATDPLRFVMGAVVLQSRNNSSTDDNQLMVYLGQQQQTSPNSSSQQYTQSAAESSCNNRSNIFVNTDHCQSTQSTAADVISSHSIITGTPTPPLPSTGVSPVAISVVGKVIPAPVVA